MRTTFENGVLRNGQQPASAVNSFIDLGEFAAMKTLSGRIAHMLFQIHVIVTRTGMGNWQKIERFQSLLRRSIIYGPAPPTLWLC